MYTLATGHNCIQFIPLISLNLKLIISMNDMKLFQVNCFLKDMSLSLLCEHKSVSFLEIIFLIKRREKFIFYFISELNSFMQHHM